MIRSYHTSVPRGPRTFYSPVTCSGLFLILLLEVHLQGVRAVNCNFDFGSYINLCGRCIQPTLDLPETDGQDRCGVCFGSNDCDMCNKGLRQDSCGECLTPDDPKWNSCRILSSALPQRIDLATVGCESEITVYGPGISREQLGEVKCNIDSAKADAPREVHTEWSERRGIRLSIDSSVLQVGTHHLHCTSTTLQREVESKIGIEVVDSCLLNVESVTPQVVMADHYFEAILFVPSIKEEMESLICFLHVNGVTRTVAHGSSVVPGRVECGPMRVTYASEVFIGIVETLEAAINRTCDFKTAKILVNTPGPTMKSATFSPDLRQLWIKFDNNVNTTHECNHAFTPETSSLFGKGWQCWFQADHLVIQLGFNPSVHPGSKLSLGRLNGIVRAQSDSSLTKMASESSTVIVDDATNEVVEPRYRVLAPQIACLSSQGVRPHSSAFKKKLQRDSGINYHIDRESMVVVQVQELGGQSLRFNWSIRLVPLPKITGQQFSSQRDMLLMWLSVRTLDKALKKVTTNQVSINSSLMLTGVEYELTVRGVNALGMSGEEKRISLKLPEKLEEMEHRGHSGKITATGCASGTPLQINLLSSPATFADAESRVELSLSCCNGDLVSEISSQVDYLWSVADSKGTMLDIVPSYGKRLILPPGTLCGGETYNISCSIIRKGNNDSLGTASIILETLEHGIQTIVNVSAVSLGTDQPLILDASDSFDRDNRPGVLEFEWSCRSVLAIPATGGYRDSRCIAPGPKRQLVDDLLGNQLKKSLLYIPPRSLALGSYQFSVRAFKGSSSSFTVVEVNIVGGSPPQVFFPGQNTEGRNHIRPRVVNPEDGVSISGIVIGLKPGCLVSWSLVDIPGYLYLEKELLGQVPYMAMEDETNHRDFSVDLPPGLEGNAKYRLRLAVDCTSPQAFILYSSYAEVDINTNAPPVTKPLKVEPVEGEGLVTAIKYSTGPAYDDIADYPLSYSFGYQVIDSNNQLSQKKYFHTTSQQLSAVTYLPALSEGMNTKLISLLKVCDTHHICRTTEGPVITTHTPTQLTFEHVEKLTDDFSNLLSAEEFEDAIILVESSMQTLGALHNKSLYELASRRVESSISEQLDVMEAKLGQSPESLHAALNFLDAASSALQHGAFSQESLQRLVDLKDRILHMLSNPIDTGLQVEHRTKRKSPVPSDGPESLDKTRRVLTSEMVKSLLSISEIAILNLNDSGRALTEKRKLLQNVSFYMESLCHSLSSSVSTFIGSKVVSFSVQKINMEFKYKEELAVPDWRSAKSGGAPINATALVQLGAGVKQIIGKNSVCMGGAIYPVDFLSEITALNFNGFARFSAVYYVKLLSTKMLLKLQQSVSNINLDGLELESQSVQIKIPVWSDMVESNRHLMCSVWSRGKWDSNSCVLVKHATLLNKPAVECRCSILGYHAIFSEENPLTTPSRQPATEPLTEPFTSSESSSVSRIASTTRQAITSVTSLPVSQSPALPVEPTPLQATTTEHPNGETPSDRLQGEATSLPPGIPIKNTTQNFTFRIQEDFASTVGSQRVAFISQLKREILRQVEMPENMIASIDVNPGSILVTLHLVDTDVRTVNDVVPALAAVLQSGSLSVNGVDGRHLSVPPQSLQLLQRSTDNPEHNLLLWITIGCAVFSIFCLTSLTMAAVIAKRKQGEQQFSSDLASPEVEVKAPTYGRFHLEQTLDGCEATLSRYRNSTTNPLVVSTVGGLASVMGTNVIPSNFHHANTVQYKLQSPQFEPKKLITQSQKQEQTAVHHHSSNASANISNSSGSSSTSRRFGLLTSAVQRHLTLPEDQVPIMHSDIPENAVEGSDEEDSGIDVITEGGKIIAQLSTSISVATSDTSKNGIGTPPEVILLPGTPVDKDK